LIDMHEGRARSIVQEYDLRDFSSGGLRKEILEEQE